MMIWEDPPVSKRKPGGGRRKGDALTYNREAEAMRANPKSWARMKVYDDQSKATAYANNVRNAVLVAFRPAGTFEAVARSMSSGEHRVYVRYVGEQTDN